MRRPPRCPKCLQTLQDPAPCPDGLPGVLYRQCGSCGYTVAVTRRPRREQLPD